MTRLKEKPKTKKTAYHLGTTSDCPRFHIVLGGVEFPRFSFKHVKNEDTDSYESYRMPGAIVNLTDEQVNKVEKALEKKVFAFYNEREAALLDRGADNPNEFEPGRYQSVKDFVFMKPAAQTGVDNWWEVHHPDPIGTATEVERLQTEAAKAAQEHEDEVADDPKDQLRRQRNKRKKKQAKFIDKD